MKGLRAFLCRHPYAALFCPLVPCIVLAAALVYFEILALPVAAVLLLWIYFLLSYPIRRIPQAMMRDAAVALERDLDPYTFLSLVEILLSRKTNHPLTRVSLGANYAAGLDAAGRSDEALAYLRTLMPERAKLDVVNGVQFDLSYAVVAVHTESGRGEIPAVLSDVRAVLPTLPPPLGAAVRETAESVRLAYALYTGEESDASLVSFYVSAIERYRREGEMSRRRLLRSCMNLARVYDRADRFADAAAMYAYVEKNGNLLGIVPEAKAARAALSLRQSAARMQASDGEGSEIVQEKEP